MSAFHFIVNPLAGSGRAAQCFAAVEDKLQSLGISYDKSITTGPHQGDALARRAIEAGAQTIVAVGGDGTINEVAAGVYGHAGVKMGILPFGTGNDFARCLGIPFEPEGALAVLLHGFTRKMDGGLANELFFINIAGLGFDVEVLRATEKYKAKRNGMFPYMMGIFDALFHMRPIPMTIEVNGQSIREDAMIVLVGNGQYFGGGMRAVPTAIPHDGLFDVRIVRKVSLPRFLTLLPAFIKGKLTETCSYLICLQTDELRVSCNESCTLDLDGELLGETPVTFKLMPGAIEMICSETTV